MASNAKRSPYCHDQWKIIWGHVLLGCDLLLKSNKDTECQVILIACLPNGIVKEHYAGFRAFPCTARRYSIIDKIYQIPSLLQVDFTSEKYAWHLRLNHYYTLIFSSIIWCVGGRRMSIVLISGYSFIVLFASFNSRAISDIKTPKYPCMFILSRFGTCACVEWTGCEISVYHL